MVTWTPAASPSQGRGHKMFQARDLHTLPRPSRPPYMSCRESTRALHEPAAATFLDVTVMTGFKPGPADSW